MRSDTPLGTELAGYRIESVIGRGGMSVVYLAEHLALRRKVALKILASDLAEDERSPRRSQPPGKERWGPTFLWGASTRGRHHQSGRTLLGT